MDFSKLLLQSNYDNIPIWKKDTTSENCYQPCLKYKTPPCKSQPKYLPQQFPPYYDNIDPNSIIKYREWPTCIETFQHDNGSNGNYIILLVIVIVIVCINLK